MSHTQLPSTFKSPLGIIGTFITLVYGIAGMVLGSSINELHLPAQYLIVIFIVVFPFIILRTVYLLVTKHNDKLYAPVDFRTDEAFHKYKNASSETLIQYDPERMISEAETSGNIDIVAANQWADAVFTKDLQATDAAYDDLSRKYGRSKVSFYNSEFCNMRIELPDGEELYVDVKLVTAKSPLQAILAQAAMHRILLSNISGEKASLMLYLVVDDTQDNVQIVRDTVAKQSEYLGGTLMITIKTFDDLISRMFK